MRWRRRHQTNIKHSVTLLVFPLLIIGIGYAVYSQSLTINGTSRKPAYTATPNISTNYTYNKTQSGGLTTYNVTANVKNISTLSITRWQVKFNLPSDFSVFSCGSSVTCNSSGQTITVDSGTGNSSIAASASVTFTFSFQTANANYQLQNLYVLGSGGTFQAISGLTVSATRTAGGGLSSSNTYSFTVTNGTGSNVRMWRIIGGPWASNYNVTSMDSRVHYMDAPNELVIIDTDSLASGTNFVFSATMTTAALWSLSSVAVTGIP